MLSRTDRFDTSLRWRLAVIHKKNNSKVAFEFGLVLFALLNVHLHT